MPYISQSSIQELKNRLDTVAVVSEYVQLEKRGGRYWACCPFHQEKTPSFTVNPDMKSFNCFGCQKFGSVFDFVMEMDKLSFTEAVELLAKKYSVELVYESSGREQPGENEDKKKAKEELFELYNRIAGTFHHFLLEKQEFKFAKQYIISRGINAKMIEKFRLGFSPPDRYWLGSFLAKKGYSAEFLASSGLFSSNKSGASLFYGRLMFPINDRQGRTVAFGGRLMEEPDPRDGWVPPKYINSPELWIYKKGETLYGVDIALPEIRKTKTAYLAEGYLDVIALHQAGISNAVAPLGTAFTEEQAKLLKRWADKVVLFFDTDNAGQAAAVKTIFTCRKNGLDCAVVVLDGEAKDPAEMLKKSGPEVLQKCTKYIINDLEYLINRAKSLYTVDSSAEGKARAIATLFPYIGLMESEVARDSCIEAVADAFGLIPSLVSDDYRRYASNQKPLVRPAAEKEDESIRMNDELVMLITVALDFVSAGSSETAEKELLFTKFRRNLEPEKIEDKNARDIFIALEECIRYGETGMEEFLARISSPYLKKFIVEKSTSEEFLVNPGRLVADGEKKLKIKRLGRRKEEMIVELRLLKKKETDEDRRKEKELLAEMMLIDNDLHNLKQGRNAWT